MNEGKRLLLPRNNKCPHSVTTTWAWEASSAMFMSDSCPVAWLAWHCSWCTGPHGACSFGCCSSGGSSCFLDHSILDMFFPQWVTEAHRNTSGAWVQSQLGTRCPLSADTERPVSWESPSPKGKRQGTCCSASRPRNTFSSPIPMPPMRIHCNTRVPP